MPEEVFPQPLASRGLSTLAPPPPSVRQRRPAVRPCQLQSASAASVLGRPSASPCLHRRFSQYSLTAKSTPPSIVSGEGRPTWVRGPYCTCPRRHEVRAMLEFRS